MNVLCINVTINHCTTRIQCENVTHACRVYAGLRRALGAQISILAPELIPTFAASESEITRSEAMLRWSHEMAA